VCVCVCVRIRSILSVRVHARVLCYKGVMLREGSACRGQNEGFEGRFGERVGVGNGAQRHTILQTAARAPRAFLTALCAFDTSCLRAAITGRSLQRRRRREGDGGRVVDASGQERMVQKGDGRRGQGKGRRQTLRQRSPYGHKQQGGPSAARRPLQQVSGHTRAHTHTHLRARARTRARACANTHACMCMCIDTDTDL
jgi:hypothetical protein